MEHRRLSFRLKTAALFIIPFIVMGLSIKLKSATGPYWLGVNSDPSYIYLMNSLYIVDHITPIFTDHPGTTLQILGAVVIKALHLNAGTGEIAGHVFDNPEYYLNAIHVVLLSIYFISLTGVAYYAFRKTKDILFALLLQTPSFLYLTLKSYGGSHYVLPIIANINAGTLLLTIGNLYVMCLLKLYFDMTKRDHIISSVLLGVVCALGIATKIPFLPLFLAPLILLPRYIPKVTFIFTLIFSWIMATLPILPRYGYMYELVKRSITRIGHLGYGEKGLIDLTNLIGALKGLAREYVLLSFVVGVCLIFILSRVLFHFKSLQDKNNPSRKGIIFLATMVFVVIAQFFMVAKQPAPHYMVPSVALLGILLGFFYQAIPSKARIKNIGVLFFLFFFMGFRTIFAMQYHGKLYERNHAIYDFSKEVHEKYQDCIIVGYYRSSSPQIAMDFGDDCGGYKAYGKDLQEKYPEVFFYNKWSRVFHRFSDHTYIQTLMKMNKCVLLYGPAINFPGYISVKQIESGRAENLYRVVATTADEAVKHYLMAKRFEARKNYKAAYWHATQAKFFGYPKADEYMKELKQLAEGRFNP